ncbi:MAG: hypothetical protein QOE33_2384 [Acidobacteriota bacterium]|nr:hypothetical protein [Acidobacteriota bacterium]
MESSDEVSDVNRRISKWPSLFALFALLTCAPISARAQARLAENDHASVEHGSLEEIRDKRAVLLVVGRSFAVDARAPAEVSAEDVRSALETMRVRKNLNAYRIVAGKLNKYARRYGSLSPVETRDDADFIIVFKIMQEHRSLIDGQPFSYGKMFIVVARGDVNRPRIVWESKGEMSLADDAAGELIRALKTMRGER